MKPKRIILVRHGESAGNADPFIYFDTPDFKVPLTDFGKEQAAVAGQHIKSIIGDETVHVYCSPFYRARETFNGIKPSLNISSAYEDPRIREQDWGHYGHPSNREVMIDARNEFSTFYYRIEDGESGADVYDRMSTFFETMHRDFAKPNFPENCLIVTHGMTLRLFLMRWFHWTVEEFEDVRNPLNCEVVIMEHNDQFKYDLISPLRRRSDPDYVSR